MIKKTDGLRSLWAREELLRRLSALFVKCSRLLFGFDDKDVWSTLVEPSIIVNPRKDDL